MKKIIALVFVILFIVLFTQDIYLGVGKYKRWYDSGAGSLLPDPEDVLGKNLAYDITGSINSSETFYNNIYLVTISDFNKYVDALVTCGFRHNFSRSDDSFFADHMNLIRPRQVWATYAKGKHRIMVTIACG